MTIHNTSNQRKNVSFVWQLILKPSKHKYTYLPTTGMSSIIQKLMVNLDITVATFSSDIIINKKKSIEICKNAAVNAEHNKTVDEIISINGLLASMTFYLLPESGQLQSDVSLK